MVDENVSSPTLKPTAKPDPDLRVYGSWKMQADAIYSACSQSQSVGSDESPSSRANIVTPATPLPPMRKVVATGSSSVGIREGTTIPSDSEENLVYEEARRSSLQTCSEESSSEELPFFADSMQTTKKEDHSKMTVHGFTLSGRALVAAADAKAPRPEWPWVGDQVLKRYTILAAMERKLENLAICNYDGYDGQRKRVVSIRVARAQDQRRPLRMEAEILRSYFKRSPHSIRLIECGDWKEFYVIVLSKSGPNLWQLRHQMQSRSFSDRTTARVAVQCIEAIRDLHSLGYIHRNIKSTVFRIGLEASAVHTIFLTEFDVAKRYLDRNGKHKAPRKNVGFRGSAFYASLNAHKKKELGRRDDMYSLFYVIVEMMKGWLPWKQIFTLEMALKLKQYYTPIRLCDALPPQFRRIAKHLNSLDYDSQPNYDFLIECITKTVKHFEEVQIGEPFDWELIDPNSAESDEDSLKEEIMVLPLRDLEVPLTTSKF